MPEAVLFGRIGPSEQHLQSTSASKPCSLERSASAHSTSSAESSGTLEVGGLGKAVVGLGAYVLVIDAKPVECVPNALHRGLVPHVPHAQHRLTWHRSPREVELEKAAVLLYQLSVSVEFSALAQVADEISVHARVVLAAGLGVGAAYRKVHRPAELLVEQDVRARPADAVVGPEPELAKVPGPGVGLEQAHQVLLTLLRARLDDLPLLEPKPSTGDLASRYRRRYAEVNRSVGRVLYGSGKDLAARHVPHPGRVHERTSLDRERQVRLRTDDTDLARLLQPLLEPLLLG